MGLRGRKGVPRRGVWTSVNKRVWTCKELRVTHHQTSCYSQPPFLGTLLVPSRTCSAMPPSGTAASCPRCDAAEGGQWEVGGIRSETSSNACGSQKPVTGLNSSISAWTTGGTVSSNSRFQTVLHPVSIRIFPLTRFSPGSGLLRNRLFS